MSPSTSKIRAGIVGATGYTGVELARILARHPDVRLTRATSGQSAGKILSTLRPELAGVCDLVLSSTADAYSADLDVLFLALGHTQTADFVAKHPALAKVRMVDLSANFRFDSAARYKQVYGESVPDALNKKFVYGIPEIWGARVKRARYVANPGCYPTSVIVPLQPLFEKKIIRTDRPLAVVSASGVSGAGATPSATTHFCEVAGDYKVYKPLREHRHLAEIEEKLGGLRLTFTPHLLPVRNGILSTIHVWPSNPHKDMAANVMAAWRKAYARSVFVRPVDHLPALAEVVGTNRLRMTARWDGETGTLLIISAIDNLIKGAAGQAVQNMNLMFGLADGRGLEHLA